MWYAKTADYWFAKVLVIEGDDMTVQWIEDVDPSTPDVCFARVSWVTTSRLSGESCIE